MHPKHKKPNRFKTMQKKKKKKNINFTRVGSGQEAARMSVGGRGNKGWGGGSDGSREGWRDSGGSPEAEGEGMRSRTWGWD